MEESDVLYLDSCLLGCGIVTGNIVWNDEYNIGNTVGILENFGENCSTQPCGHR